MKARRASVKVGEGPIRAKYQTWWVWLWGVVALGLIALLFYLPFVWWALAALVMFGTMEGIGLAVGGRYPPLTDVIASYVPRWVAFTLIFALVGAAGATWYHVTHPVRIAALVGLLGWFTAHFDVTFASIVERAKYRRLATAVKSGFRKSSSGP